MSLLVRCDTCPELRIQKVPEDKKERDQFLWDIGWVVDVNVTDAPGCCPTHKCPFCAGPEHEKKLRKIFDRGTEGEEP